MKKILVLLFVFLLFGNLGVIAKEKQLKRDFSSVINDSGIEKNAIAISIKDLNSGNAVYQLNEKILMHPASVQKLLTLPAAVDILGEDYEFSTELYKRAEGEYLIKLGADPYLTSNDLKKLVSKIDSNTKRIYIDDTILEKKDWGEGWQWDDDMNILMPRFNSYNLDKNLIKITVMPTENGQPATIINPSKYPLVFFNNIVTGNDNSVKISRDNSISANTLVLDGCVNKPIALYIPTNNLKRYFYIRLTNVLADKKIYLKENFMFSQKTDSDEFVDKIFHKLDYVDILKNSNNMVSETVSKLAGGKFYNQIGTDISGVNVFRAFVKKQGIDTSKIRLTDASGVSKNNLISADFISEYLVRNKNNNVLKYLPSPGEGTLTHRMLPLTDNLKAKTGTHGDASAIAGFLTTKQGNKYAFCIIVNDPTSTISDMKVLEDYLIREAYFSL